MHLNYVLLFFTSKVKYSLSIFILTIEVKLIIIRYLSTLVVST